MDKAVKTKIEFEISQLDIVVQKAGVLVLKCKVQDPDYIELCASASMLHSYYNGLESIFNLIAKGCDGVQLSGTSIGEASRFSLFFCEHQLNLIL